MEDEVPRHGTPCVILEVIQHHGFLETLGMSPYLGIFPFAPLEYGPTVLIFAQRLTSRCWVLGADADMIIVTLIPENQGHSALVASRRVAPAIIPMKYIVHIGIPSQ